MKKRLILFLFVFIFSPLFCHAKRKEISDSISHLAYSKTNHDSAILLFKKAEKFIKNDTQKANYYFYYYFYHLKNNYRTEAERIQNITIQYLSETNQMEKLEWIFSTTYWEYVGESQFDKSMALCKKIEKITLEKKDTMNYLFSQIKISNVYHDMTNYEEGIKVGKNALKIAKSLRNNNMIANVLIVIAMNYDDWGKQDKAIETYHQILNMKLTDQFNYTQTYNNLGNSYLKKNNLDSALIYIMMAYNIYKGQNAPYELATYINNLGDIYLKKGDLKLSKFYLDSAYYYAKKSDNHEKLRDVCFNLYKFYNKINDYKNSLDFFTLYHSYKDSILDVKRLAIIQNLENKAKESEFQNQLLTLENKTKVRNLWIAIFSALLFIALLIIRQVYLKRQRIAKEAEINLQNERLRISRDLHDNIGAELTYISSFIDQQTFLTKDEIAKKELEKISNSSRLAMSQMRETIWAIQNNDINIEELESKLFQILEKYTKVRDIQLKIRKSGENYILKPAILISIIRVCQEAVNNAIKYSSCKLIEIDINAEEKKLFILIKDNGIGFDLNQIKFGNGINNMNERIAEVGGKFEVNSELNKGTQLSFTIPINI